MPDPTPAPTATRVMLARVADLLAECEYLAANLAMLGRTEEVQVWCDRYWRLRGIEEGLLRRVERERTV